MKKKLLLCLLVLLFVVTGCGSGSSGSSSNTKSNTFKIKDVVFTFDQDTEFHNIKYKNAKELEPDESKQSVYLEYINKDIYDGRFVYRISLSFTDETTLEKFLDGYESEKININGISWNKIKVNNKVDNKDTTSILYATEKNSMVYVVTAIEFNESNVNLDELTDVFINGVTLK